MGSKKDEHIDYSNLPDDLVVEPRRIDMRPTPGHDGHEMDRRFKPGTTIGSAEEVSNQFGMAADEDSKVFFEVMDVLDALEGWVTRKAINARSKPTRDLLYDLQDWVERNRESILR
jgi:hypothetical protein